MELTDLSVGQYYLQLGQAQLAKGKWQLAQAAFREVLLWGQAILERQLPGEASAAGVAEVLFQSGIHLNTTQAHSTSMSCFSTALTLLSNSYGALGHPCVAMALKHAVNTCLHIGDCVGASNVVQKYRHLLEGADEQSKLALAYILYDLGISHVEHSLCTSATDPLEQCYFTLLKMNVPYEGPKIAKLLSSLGYCYLVTNDSRAKDCLAEAMKLWKSLNWPFEEVNLILNTMKHYLETQFMAQNFDDDLEVCEEMLKLNQLMTKMGQHKKVCHAFTYLGTVAFHKENEKKATFYFEQAIALCKSVPGQMTGENREEIQKLLRFVGVASYNARDFHKAAKSYLECLSLLEKGSNENTAKASQIAECCASLGFTYSRLRDFDNMLRYYEKALELEGRLAPEDLQLIETNIGSLYHVKAVNHEQNANRSDAIRYYNLAETAFNRALRYSWKSFPYINYGYYLLCRGQYTEAASVLQQGYLNGVIDKDTVEFDHTEDPILIDDLRIELEGREDIRMPAVVIALYLKTLAQCGMGNTVGASHTAVQLEHEVNACRFDTYYTEGYGEDRMKALSFSLLGYAYRSLGWYSKAQTSWQMALTVMPGYRAAMKNLRCISAFNKNVK